MAFKFASAHELDNNQKIWVIIIRDQRNGKWKAVCDVAEAKIAGFRLGWILRKSLQLSFWVAIKATIPFKIVNLDKDGLWGIRMSISTVMEKSTSDPVQDSVNRMLHLEARAPAKILEVRRHCSKVGVIEKSTLVRVGTSGWRKSNTQLLWRQWFTAIFRHPLCN